MAANRTSVEILVIGAGGWGLASAWRCAEAGADTAILDDGGAAATDVAAGMLAPWSELEDDGEYALHDARRAACAAWPGFADALEAAAEQASGYVRCGALHVAARPEHVGALRRLQRTIKEHGEAAAWQTGTALRDLEPGLGPAVSGGLELPGEHQADPLVAREALRVAAARAGVRAIAQSARSLADGWVTLADGSEIAARTVVLAAGCAASRLSDAVPIRPVKGEVLTLAPRAWSAPLTRIVRTPDVYLAPRPDGRVIVGATMEESSDPAVGAGAVHDLLAEAVHTVPAVRGLAFAGVAVGFRPATPDGLPALGVDEDGVVWAGGGYRHGILLLPLVGEAVLAAAEGRAVEASVAPFSPLRLAGTPCT